MRGNKKAIPGLAPQPVVTPVKKKSNPNPTIKSTTTEKINSTTDEITSKIQGISIIENKVIESISTEKKIKNLRKKIRQIEEIEEKITQGSTITDEQQEKISKKSEILNEISLLENETA